VQGEVQLRRMVVELRDHELLLERDAHVYMPRPLEDVKLISNYSAKRVKMASAAAAAPSAAKWAAMMRPMP